MKALVPVAALLVAVGCASTHFPDPHGQVMDVRTKPWRAETSTEVVILSVPSIDRGSRTNLAGAAIYVGDPRRHAAREQSLYCNTLRTWLAADAMRG